MNQTCIVNGIFFGRSGLPLCPAEYILNPSFTKLARAAWLEITIQKNKIDWVKADNLQGVNQLHGNHLFLYNIFIQVRSSWPISNGKSGTESRDRLMQKLFIDCASYPLWSVIRNKFLTLPYRTHFFLSVDRMICTKKSKGARELVKIGVVSGVISSTESESEESEHFHFFRFLLWLFRLWPSGN